MVTARNFHGGLVILTPRAKRFAISLDLSVGSLCRDTSACVPNQEFTGTAPALRDNGWRVDAKRCLAVLRLSGSIHAWINTMRRSNARDVIIMEREKRSANQGRHENGSEGSRRDGRLRISEFTRGLQRVVILFATFRDSTACDKKFRFNYSPSKTDWNNMKLQVTVENSVFRNIQA